jgi:hypothetical protein
MIAHERYDERDYNTTTSSVEFGRINKNATAQSSFPRFVQPVERPIAGVMIGAQDLDILSTRANPDPDEPAAPETAAPTDAEKRGALGQVLATASFERAEQLRSFLRYICEAEIAGRGADLSEYIIGIEALGKPPGYSTGDDSSVRKRAHDLRQRLEELYAGELVGARVRIELPKGRYAPRFLYAPARKDAALVSASPVLPAPAADVVGRVEPLRTAPPTRILAKVFWFGFIVGVLAVLAGQLVWSKLHPGRLVVADPGRVFEAEARSNVFEGDAEVAPCPACSGRNRVKWIGKAGALTLPVDVPTNGAYMLQVDYLVDGPRTFFISVNGGEALEMPVRGNDWWIPASTAVMVRLNAGPNTIRLFNTKTYAPDLDRIVLR